MSHGQDSSLSATELLHLLRSNARWWIAPAVACAMLAAVYSLVAPRYWRATQALTVRPEAAGVSEQRLGKFADLSEMKVLQATILELAKSQGVVQETLKAVGPTGWFRSEANWPTAQDVADFREQVDLRPPGGAEFGQTEVFYLSVLDKNRARASALVAALADQLESRMKSLRDARAQSMMAELEGTVAMAENDLAVRTLRLSDFEAQIGADLPELRNLISTNGTPSDAASEMQAIEAERRANEALRRENEQLLALLTIARQDPRQLVAMPTSLLKSQPALSRLKDALVDAQVVTANRMGRLAEAHPFVVAARETQQRIRDQLHEELSVAIAGLEVDLDFNASRDRSLGNKLSAGRERLAGLAAGRAEYANLVAAVESHARIVEAALKNLADARADHASAHSASVIGRIDGVEAGVRPVGLGRSSITAAGGVGGLLLGLGLVFLFGDSLPTASESKLADVVRLKTERPRVNGHIHPVHRAAGDLFSFFRGIDVPKVLRGVKRTRPRSFRVH
jgi:uncharacterized protein involved in exopolysaccharide biosynthesis